MSHSFLSYRGVAKGNDTYREVHIRHARIQANAYCHLASLHKYRIRLFDMPTLNEEYLECEADYEKASQDISKVIAVQRNLNDVLSIK